MGRDNRSRGGRRNFHRNERNNQNQDKSWQTEKRLHENEVGIEEFISDNKGFHAIIKCRYVQ